jgi:hypothetical protein
MAFKRCATREFIGVQAAELAKLAIETDMPHLASLLQMASLEANNPAKSPKLKKAA